MRKTLALAAIVAGSLVVVPNIAAATEQGVYNWTFMDLSNNPVGSGTMTLSWNNVVGAANGSIMGKTVHLLQNRVPGSAVQAAPEFSIEYSNPVAGMSTWNLNGAIYETYDDLYQFACGGPTYVGGIALYSARPSTAYEFEQDNGTQTATSSGSTITCSYGNNIVDLWTSNDDGTYTETQGTLTLVSQTPVRHPDGPAHAGGPGQTHRVTQ